MDYCDYPLPLCTSANFLLIEQSLRFASKQVDEDDSIEHYPDNSRMDKASVKGKNGIFNQTQYLPQKQLALTNIVIQSI